MIFVKNFMRKHILLIVSAKVLKLLLVLFLFSCSGKPASDNKKQDTVKVNTDMPGDTVIYKNNGEEEEESEDEDNGNPMVPQES